MNYAIPGQNVAQRPAAEIERQTPLKREIGELRLANERLMKTVSTLTDVLKPLWTEKPANAKSVQEAPDVTIAEVPSTVRTERRKIEVQTESLQWLIDNLEV